MPNLNTIVGKFGNGKTSTAVSMALEHMAKGGVVAANINLVADPFISRKWRKAQCGFKHALRTIYGWEYQEGQFIYLPDTETCVIETSRGKKKEIPKIARFWEHVPEGKIDLPVLVFVDEAHKVWPQTAWEYMPTGDTEVIMVLRHLNIECYWMTQHQENCWVALRRVTEDWIYVSSIKKSGLGIIGRFPPVLRPFFSLAGLFIRFLFWPLIRLIPDYIQIRRFRAEEEIASNLCEGYPKVKLYSPLVYQSYDSPKAVANIEMRRDLPNDFRGSGAPVKERKHALKKFAPAVGGLALFGCSIIWGCARFSVRDGDKPSVLPSPEIVRPESSVSAPSVPVSKPSSLGYVWFSVVNDRASVGLPDGRVLVTGDFYPSSPIRFLTVSNGRLVLSDGSRVPMVKHIDPVESSNSPVSVKSLLGFNKSSK